MKIDIEWDTTPSGPERSVKIDGQRFVEAWQVDEAEKERISMATELIEAALWWAKYTGDEAVPAGHVCAGWAIEDFCEHLSDCADRYNEAIKEGTR